MRLLIIEDEEDILDALVRGFRKLGYAVDTAADGSEGYILAAENRHDLIVLDLNLPGMDGIDILKKLKEEGTAAKILVLSARTSYAQRIMGLDVGADDYLVKPFDFGELEARVRNLLRRDFTQNGAQISIGNLLLNTAVRTVYAGEKQVELSPKEYRILEYLAIHSGRAISAEELIEHVWEDDEVLFSNAVKVHISTLRKKLSAYAPNLIENIRGTGYVIGDKKT
ncbi:MAG: response regulator transcription factor [Christensenellaceae bacterium]|jgi:DNA-binding response OmpR family regulator